MSQEDVLFVRRFVEAGERSLEVYWEDPRSGAAALEAGDLNPELEEVLAYLHPDIELNPLSFAVQGGSARGHLGYLRFWDELLATSEDFELTVTELADLGGGQVLMAVEQTTKWKGSGVVLHQASFTVVSLREGLIVRLDNYRDREEALEAVGLRE